MTDFLKSLSIGMQIAQNRHKNFLEIHDIFYELKKQLESFGKGKILIEFVSQSGDFFNNEKQDNIYEDKKLYASLAVNPDIVFEQLTEVKFSNEGYPCTIYVDDNLFDAFDKTGLENNLKILLESPLTGQKLFDLLTQ